MESPFVRRPTVSRQSGPNYVNSYALKGIQICYQQPIPIPDPVVLPAGLSLSTHFSDDQFRIDLSKEKEVLNQAVIRRQAIAGEVTSPQQSLQANLLPPPGVAIPLIPYQSSSILTPVPVSTPESTQVAPTSSSNNVPTLDVPLGEMSLRDFEGDISDPFETTALQAIDVISELQSVLQPETSTNTSSVDTTRPPPRPPRPTPPPPPPTTSHSSPPPYPPAYSANESDDHLYEVSPYRPKGGMGVLVDVGASPQPTEPTPITLTGPPAVLSQRPQLPPITGTSFTSGPPPVPPKPKPRSSPSTSPKPTHRPFSGVAVLPPIGNLPAYSSEPNSYATSYNPPPSPPPVVAYSLPDIRSSLTSDEMDSVRSISGMGFPATRVARVLRHYEGDNQKVFDLLLVIGKLEEKGYNGDSAEVALLFHDEDADKALSYLKEVNQYKEVWPEEKIHEAYKRAGGNWDETVDVLTQGR